jgi:hypothetical protein
MLNPRPISKEAEYFRTGIRIKKDVWDRLSIACQTLEIRKGKLLEKLIEDWLDEQAAKVAWHLRNKNMTDGE